MASGPFYFFNNMAKNIETELTEAQVEAIDIILGGNEMYKHCCVDGKIFSGDYENVVIDLKKLTGRTSLTKEFLPYRITSGYCHAHKLLLQECSDEGLTQEEVDYLMDHEEEI